jgi:hypothetical protein
VKTETPTKPFARRTQWPRAGCSGGANWYAYVNNDPVNWVDEWGLSGSDAATVAAMGYWGGGAMEQEPEPVAVPTPAVPTARILQTDPAIEVLLGTVNVMATQGCFFMSCLGVAQTATNTILTAQQVQTLVTTTQSAGAVEPNMSVNPGRAADVVNAAFQLLGSPQTASIVGGTGYAGPAEASLVGGVTVNNNPHWREGDQGGNVVWDPYGAGNVTFQPGLSATRFVFFGIQGD